MYVLIIVSSHGWAVSTYSTLEAAQSAVAKLEVRVAAFLFHNGELHAANVTLDL